MWNPNQDRDEDEEEGLDEMDETPFLEVPVLNGPPTYVEERFHPMIMEWDWQYDAQLEQVVRIEGDKKRTLFEEQLRWHFRQRRRDTDDMPIPDRKAIRGLFGHLPTFRTLLKLSTSQREFATFEGGYNLPAATHLLAEALGDVLLMYFEWQAHDNVWQYEPDTTGLTPGKLTLQPKGNRKYATLGEWMRSEYTGDWSKSNKTATGLSPQTYKALIQKKLMAIWRHMVRDENFDEVRGKDVEELLRDGERPAFLTMQYVRALIGHYPL